MTGWAGKLAALLVGLVRGPILDSPASNARTKRHLTAPTQCVLWKNPEKFASAGLLKKVQVYERRDSHEGRYILECTECGQLYYYCWEEMVDFDNGNDTTFEFAVPVQTAEEIAEVTADDTNIFKYVPMLLNGGWVT